MKLIYSIRFKLLASILLVIAISLPFLVYIAIQLGNKQLENTYELSRRKIMDNTKRWSTILSRLTFGSLRESMAKYDVEAMQKIVRMARGQQDIKSVRIFGPTIGPSGEGKVRFNGDSPELPKEVENIECGACHSGMRLKEGLAKSEFVDAASRVDAKIIEKDLKGERSFQMIVHVYNQDDPCWQCHKAAQKINGVLQVNVSLHDVDRLLAEMKEQVEKNKKEFAGKVMVWGALFTFIVSFILLVIATTIVNKIAKFRHVAERISLGETDVTLDDIAPSRDEIGELRDSFERMLVAIKFFMMPEEEFPEETL